MNEWALEAVSLAAWRVVSGRCASGWRSCSLLLRERRAAVISESFASESGSAADWF